MLQNKSLETQLTYEQSFKRKYALDEIKSTKSHSEESPYNQSQVIATSLSVDVHRLTVSPFYYKHDEDIQVQSYC